jgi:hypothetical protein
MAGAPPISHDPYPRHYRNREGDLVILRRGAVKKLTGCLQFDTEIRERWPRGMASAGRGIPVNVVIDRIVQANPAIAHLLGVGAGHTFQFHESQILVEILTRCMMQGVVALPAQASTSPRTTKRRLRGS